MSTIHKFIILSAAVLAAMPAANVQAQTAPDQGKMDGMKMDQPALPTVMTEAEVRKVDMERKKLTLKHGDIKNLEMPA